MSSPSIDAVTAPRRSALPSFGWRLLGLLVLLLILAWGGLFACSAIPLSGTQAIQALFSSHATQVSDVVVRQLRLPRVLVAGLVGACLAAAGVLMQGLTRNPLASPGVFGVNAGAALGVALVSTFAGWMGVMGQSTAAVLGGGIAWTLVMLLGAAWRPGADKGRLVLAGVAVAALCGALTRASIILAEDQAAGVMTWLAGSVANARWVTWAQLWPVACASLLAAMALAPSLNILAVGDEQARNLGMRLGWVRLAVGIVVLVLVSASVVAAGSLAFVGLLVPHMARALVGIDHRKLLPASVVLGAALVIAADVLGRAVAFPAETPAGAVLALIGAPWFIYMVRSRT
ncbi:iron chelate uptake ABC transporter family permease subunit [Pokkaliibacter sp. MBI-7]|uniref:iron chelate uptake ABC transporter family permease subunit n=1 Tax=Pokkaliibacter sp. MBI-7 TaxID=3040600 RepID=UPI00244CD296|nr:iron chelate uptake ABC transporter family permease subunit [Pokkaliibacter sp. MBI-7]MDH2431453.1 iron chelate uptake ABC transporter family permease subunit [Pokkaliibacter sp. MBI-7]